MPRDAAFEQAPRTLVLVLSSECHFCQKSVPELATLSTEAERKFRIPTVAVFRPSDRGADAFLRETGFVGNVIKISAPQLSSLPTPTPLFVNDKEQVLGNWVGQVTPERASTILSAMAATRAPKSMK